MKKTLSLLLAIIFTLAIFAGSVSADGANEKSPVGNTIDGWHSLYVTGDQGDTTVHPLAYQVREKTLWVEVVVEDEATEGNDVEGIVYVYNVDGDDFSEEGEVTFTIAHDTAPAEDGKTKQVEIPSLTNQLLANHAITVLVNEPGGEDFEGWPHENGS